MHKFIPYGTQNIDEDDIQAVVNVLKSDFISTGPMVMEFEKNFADKVNSKYAVAVSSGTAALYRPMMDAILLMPSREVIMPSMPPRMGVAPKRSAAR